MPNPKNNYPDFSATYLNDTYDKERELRESRISQLFSTGLVVPGKHGIASMFSVGDKVVIKDKTFKVVYVNESFVGFEPVSMLINSVKGE